MYSKAIDTIKKYNMLQRGDSIVAGLSGGADSCALVHVLAGIREKFGIDVAAVHINHGIRGSEADADEKFAKAFCEGLGVKFIVYHCDVPAEAVRRGLGEEETGRLIRYEKFRETAEMLGANKIAVAHNLNDRTETFLMNLCRGAGMKGLSGIPAVSGNIIRPLIECSRESIEKYCAENSIDFRTDSTNLQNEYTRNKIRNVLIPWLKENINPAADMNIASAAELLREDEAFLEDIAEDVLSRATVEKHDDFTALDCDVLLKEKPVVVRRVLRKALRGLRPDLKDFSRVHIENTEKILHGETGRKINLPDGVTAQKSYGRLELSRRRDIAKAYSYDIN
ncbi:MAG: tRNA lysidine(34) synthetase TilS, partial [Clostridiales bacterium]|nr:tRNA lysidine(34) synthetase TilS [Clostridiales bacterium]